MNSRVPMSNHDYQSVYATSTKKQKMMISRSVVDKIHNLPGKFLEKRDGLWREVDGKRALERGMLARETSA